jgi:hypothetical protein
LVFSENKTVGKLEKCSTVDLLQFFKNRPPEIRHFGSRCYFELFQKKFFHGLFAFDGGTKRSRSF